MDSGRSLSQMIDEKNKKKNELLNFMIESNKIYSNNSKLSSPFITKQKKLKNHKFTNETSINKIDNNIDLTQDSYIPSKSALKQYQDVKIRPTRLPAISQLNVSSRINM